MENEADKTKLADRFLRVRTESLEQGRQLAENSYWLERDKSLVPTDKSYGYSLYVNGIERAIADPIYNRAVILGGNQIPAQKIVAPDSQTVFAAVEEKLGLGTVHELRYGNAERNSKTVSAVRQHAEQRAAKFRSNVPVDKEAGHYLLKGQEDLNKQAQNGGLSKQGQEARDHINTVLVELGRNQNRWNREIGEHVSTARDRLGEVPETEETKHAPFEYEAGMEFSKALAVAERSASVQRDSQDRGERAAADKSKSQEKDTGRSR